MDGLIFGGKFAFQNRMGKPYYYIVGRKFTVFTLFYFLFEGNFQVQASRGGGLYLEGRFNGGFFALRVLGAYIWRGLFSEFYGIMLFYKVKKFLASSVQVVRSGRKRDGELFDDKTETKRSVSVSRRQQIP